ncbi:MAG TPA: hypothetical protein VK801_10505 [Caulobacteraceae bacterium]|jgi:hypothetical protein|nr:hypothetical protein [Caulobacteraceae bacterium]
MTKVEEYRAREREALAFAEETTLDRVREQRRRAAAIWTAMADAEEARVLSRSAATTQAAR